MKKKDKFKTLIGSDFLTEYAKKAKIPKGFNKNSRTIRDTVEHFKNDKWPLDIDYIKDQIIHEVLGFDILSYVIREMNKRKLKVCLGERGDKNLIALEEKKQKEKNVSKQRKRT
jgi:hypothetical protein